MSGGERASLKLGAIEALRSPKAMLGSLAVGLLVPALALPAWLTQDGPVAVVQVAVAVLVSAGLFALVFWTSARQLADRAFAKRYAAASGLSYVEEAKLPEITWLLRSGLSRRARNLMQGPTPDDACVALAHLDVTSRVGKHAATFNYTVALYELPETPAFLTGLACVPRTTLPPELEQVPVESSTFANRYDLGAPSSADRNRVLQLFSPSFIAWLVEEPSPGVNFELNAGMLCVWVIGALETSQKLDQFRAAGDRIASRIAEEAAE